MSISPPLSAPIMPGTAAYRRIGMAPFKQKLYGGAEVAAEDEAAA